MLRPFIAVLLTVALSAVPLRTQGEAPLDSFFRQNIGLKDAEIGELNQGRAIAKILDSPTPAEVFVFGAVLIKAQPAAFLRLATNLDKLKTLPGYLAIQQFSNPPALADLAGFDLDADDMKALKECETGDCDVQLPESTMEQFRKTIDWSRPDANAQANNLAKNMALRAVTAYQQGGNVALGTYRDKKEPTQVSEQFRKLLSRSTVLPTELPQLNAYLLNYPNASLPESSSVLYWEKIKFGLKPTLRINHQITARLNSQRNGPIDVLAIKQLYASHYFQTAIDMYFCVPHSADTFYLITAKGSTQAGLTGVRGSIMRKIAVDKTRSSLQKSLEAIKVQLEK